MDNSADRPIRRESGPKASSPATPTTQRQSALPGASPPQRPSRACANAGGRRRRLHVPGGLRPRRRRARLPLRHVAPVRRHKLVVERLRRRLVEAPIHRRDESVSASRQRLDVTPRRRRIVEHVPILLTTTLRPASKSTNVSSGQSAARTSSRVTSSPGRASSRGGPAATDPAGGCDAQPSRGRPFGLELEDAEPQDPRRWASFLA